MNRITSATGTTTSANEDIMIAMKTATTLNGTEDSTSPFRARKLALATTTTTTIKVNGENATTLEENQSTGEFFINLGYYDISVKTLEIVDSGIEWRATFLF